MKNISILPAEYRQNQKKYKMVSVYILLAAFAIVAYTAALAGSSIWNRNLERELSMIQYENRGLKAEITSLTPYKEAQERIKAIDSLIGKAAGTNPEWKALFDKLFVEIPENLWISNISCIYKGDSKEFIVKGSTMDNSNISHWLIKLKNMQELKDVNCKLSSDSSQTISFEIWAKLSDGKPWELNLEGGARP